jgi:hypothetical protein
MKVPLKKNPAANMKGSTKPVISGNLSAYDIILGKIEIKTEMIPTYIQILDDYEGECSMDARYIEAEMAKHKKDELKKLAKKVEKEKALNNHLKEKVEVEEAYLNEFNEFQKRWTKKLDKFELKVEESRKEMIDHQKAQMEEAANKIEEKYALAAKESNNNILNLMKIEKTLAKQKNYIDAQKTREQWQQEKEALAIRQKMEIEKKKAEIYNEFELKNKKEVDEFIEKINEMRIKLENERQRELDALLSKYEKIKGQLKTLQESEAKRLETGLNYKVKDINETHLNETNSFVSIKKADNLETKKKIIMKKINRLNA